TAVLRIVPASILGASLILAAGFVHGDGKPVIWVAALVIGFLGPFFADVRGWRLAPAHFVERHGLIVIIAIGESLVAIGLGARSTELSVRVIVAALLGLVVVISFWLAYFGFFPLRALPLLTVRHGADRMARGRDGYSCLR